MNTNAHVSPAPPPVFRHEAFFYAGEDELVEGLASFVRDGLAAGEPTLAVLSAAKIVRLKGLLGSDARHVSYADMGEVGMNPARIIPAWREFVSAQANGHRLRGIGEPISPERNQAELVECHRHEALLNVAFADGPDFWLLCPYDTDTLGQAVIEDARRTHPFVSEGGSSRRNADHESFDVARAWLDDPLPEPRGEVLELDFGASPLQHLRALVSEYGERAGLSTARVADLALAVHEAAANSQRHGGGRGTLRIWRDDRALICEVRDGGRIDEPLVGRVRPRADQAGGRGLWLVNQLCDLVQLRSSGSGTVVRLHMWL